MEKNAEFFLNNSDIELLKRIGIPVIDSNRKYWFLRTQGGEYYDKFIAESYVAIEWDEINDFALIADSNREDELRKEIAQRYPKCEQPGAVISTLRRFVCEFSAGDIVIIPNKDSKIWTFGEIVSENVYLGEDDAFEAFIDGTEDDAPMPRKRRDVRWIKSVSRNKLDPYLHKIIYSRNTIVDVNSSQLFIDRTLYPVYVKGNEAFLTSRVQRKANIPFSDMYALLDCYSRIITTINQSELNTNMSLDDFVLKINVQSEGPVQIKGAVAGVLAFAVFSYAICGGTVSVAGIEIESNGLAPIIEAAANAYATLNNTEQKEGRENSKHIEMEKLKEDMSYLQDKLELEMPKFDLDFSIFTSTTVKAMSNRTEAEIQNID